MPNFIPIRFGTDGREKLVRHLKSRILALETGLTVLHEEKITKWRKAYEAVPREPTREFPFYNASNLVVPIIATFTDTLLARVMSSVLKTRPPFVCKIFGDHADLSDDIRASLEEFMEYVSFEPEELDLYRVYHEWYGDAIKYGTSIVKCPHEKRWIDELLSSEGDGSGSKAEFVRTLQYEGPRPEKIPFERFGIPPQAKTLDGADIIYHKRVLTREELMERRFFQIYDPVAVDSILTKPDRSGPSNTVLQNEDTLGAHTTAGYGYGEWDVYECWLKWKTPDGKFQPRIIATLHKTTNTLLRAVYDTHTLLPFSLARLFYRDDMIYGYGFCETLWQFQEEISEQHNGRLDNRTIANTRVWRVSPDSKLHAGYRIYPSALLPAEKDEIEALQAGDISEQTIDDEKFSIELAQQRAGVAPPLQGQAGGPNKKGVYTAMGTLSLLQEGNRRTDLNISDLRYAHTRLGRIILCDYSKFGIRNSLKGIFGEKGVEIQKALEAYKSNKIGLPIYSSTASVNREVEKQNDFILVNLMRQHYMATAQLIAQINSPVTPPDLKDYLKEVIKASNLVLKSVLRNFEKEDVDILVPEPKLQEDQGGQQPQPGQAPQPPGQIPSSPSPLLGMAGQPGNTDISALLSRRKGVVQ
jgi:hypothetical protein